MVVPRISACLPIRLASLTLTVVSCITPATLAQEASAAAVLPDWSSGLRTLVVDDSHLEEGVVYYLEPGQDTQFEIELGGELFRIVATSSRGSGFFVGPIDQEELEKGESPVFSGAIRLPVASLTSGTASDRLMHSPLGLDAAAHPDIGFVFRRAENVRPSESGGANETSYDLTLHGELRVKEKVLPVAVDAELSFLLTTNQTFARNVGDLARLEGELELPLADLGIGLPPRLGSRFGDTARVDFFLMFTSADPERPLMPPSTPEAFSLENRYLVELRDRGRAAEAYRAGEELLATAWDDAETLERFAVRAVFEAGPGRRFLGQARRAAERAVELRGETPSALAVNALARIASETGDLQRAVTLQRRALELAEAGGGRFAQQAGPQMRANLVLYEQLLEAKPGGS